MLNLLLDAIAALIRWVALKAIRYRRTDRQSDYALAGGKDAQ